MDVLDRIIGNKYFDNLVPLFDLKYVIRYPIYGCFR